MMNRPLAHFAVFALGSTLGFATINLVRTNDDPSRTHLVDTASPSSGPRPTAESISPIPAPQSIAATTEPADFVGSFDARIATALAFDSKRRQAWELERLFEDMAPGDAPQIMALLTENSEPRPKNLLFGPFFEKWGAIDGAAALAAARTLDPREQESATKSVFNGWAQADLQAAWTVAQTYLDDPNKRVSNLARGVLAEVALQDPDSLLRLYSSDAKHHLNGMIQDKVVEAAFESGQPGALLQRLYLIEEPALRSRWIQDIYRRWGSENPDAALDSLSSITDSAEANVAMSGYIQGWSRSDPKGAFEYSLANPSDPAVQASFVNLTQEMLRSASPDDAEALIQRIADSGLLYQAANSIGSHLANLNPSSAIRFANQLPDESMKNRVIGYAIGKLAQTDFPAAREKWLQFPDTNEKHNLVTSMALQFYRNPDAGANLCSLLDALPPSQRRTQNIEQLLTLAQALGSDMSRSFKTALQAAALEDPNLSETSKSLAKALVDRND